MKLGQCLFLYHYHGYREVNGLCKMPRGEQSGLFSRFSVFFFEPDRRTVNIVIIQLWFRVAFLLHRAQSLMVSREFQRVYFNKHALARTFFLKFPTSFCALDMQSVCRLILHSLQHSISVLIHILVTSKGISLAKIF